MFFFVIIIMTSGTQELFHYHRNSLLQPGKPSLSSKTQRRAAHHVYDPWANGMAVVH